MKKENFEQMEDEVISFICDDCNAETSSGEDFCENCFSHDGMIETSFEGSRCCSCSLIFEPFSTAYISNEYEFLCPDCFESIEE